MHLASIEVDPNTARREFLRYREVLRQPVRQRATEADLELRRIDEEMRQAYKQLAKGFTLIKLSETVRAGGYTEFPFVDWNNRTRVAWLPNLAVVPAIATTKAVYCDGVNSGGGVTFHTKSNRYHRSSQGKKDRVVLKQVWNPVEHNDPRMELRLESSARVPSIPPQFRPEQKLDGYHLLFESVWNVPPQPADPALLKHVGGDLYAVLATWDLTPLEAAVLGQRR